MNVRTLVLLTTLCLSILAPGAAALRGTRGATVDGETYYASYQIVEGCNGRLIDECYYVENYVEAWSESNGVPGLQRYETCADGSFAWRGCSDGSAPIPADTRLARVEDDGRGVLR